MGIFNPNIPGNAATADLLKTARLIGGVSFNGGANINLPGVNQPGNQNTSGRSAVATLSDYATAAGYSTTAATATKLSTTKDNWAPNGVIDSVVGLLAWKNYGNSHVVFDASAGTSPSGTAISSTTNPDDPWMPTYATLMGWNGVLTYGVRVDSSRRADSAAAADSATTAAACSGNAFSATNIYQDNDPTAGTYRILLGNHTDEAGLVYNFSSLFFNSTTATIQGANISGNAATATTAAACSGNSATATTAAACSGNSSTATKLSNAVGSAPSYSARAWVNFNANFPATIRNSANVSSITDVGTGIYIVNFATALTDANYSVSTQGTYTASGPTLGAMFPFVNGSTRVNPTASNFYVSCQNFAGGLFNDEYSTLSVFR